ncbi:hypothetical protein [Lachnoclostridium sp.]|uniref:hypothetical protein n=1 Tax=Lachnoclostridium sp. TaxID=2028282 RepID=UPI0028989F6B|nr:hypothetical protein [Lachnoclostridium sp.]
MGKRKMDSIEQEVNIVNEVYEAFLSMLSAGCDYNEAYKTSKEMLPRGCSDMFYDQVHGNLHL